MTASVQARVSGSQADRVAIGSADSRAVEPRAARAGDTGDNPGWRPPSSICRASATAGCGTTKPKPSMRRELHSLGGDWKVIRLRQLVVSRPDESSAERILSPIPDGVVRAELHDYWKSSGGLASRKNRARADRRDRMLPARATAHPQQRDRIADGGNFRSASREHRIGGVVSAIGEPLSTIFEMGAMCCFINRKPG